MGTNPRGRGQQPLSSPGPKWVGFGLSILGQKSIFFAEWQFWGHFLVFTFSVPVWTPSSCSQFQPGDSCGGKVSQQHFSSAQIYTSTSTSSLLPYYHALCFPNTLIILILIILIIRTLCVRVWGGQIITLFLHPSQTCCLQPAHWTAYRPDNHEQLVLE